MARLIVKSGFLSPAAGGATHLVNYVHYIATREGVELNAENASPQAEGDHAPGWKQPSDLPSTEKQQRMIRQLLEDFPDSRSSLEYEDYRDAPSMATASEFIGRTMEDNFGAEHWREDYVYYLATRPGAERSGSHGLWGADDEPLDLDEIAYRVANHSGNVWTHIISLRREDAQKVGMETAERWRELIRAQTNTIAQAMGIPAEDLRWYAAFHNESHHPHIHMVAYSVGAEPFLGKQGLRQIKSALAGEIFREELLEIYRQQTKYRDDLTGQWREMLADADALPQIETPLRDLANYLSGYQGRPVYGYLSRAQRAQVDRIVDRIAEIPRIRQLYEDWYAQRDKITGIYKGEAEQRQPLSQNKTFKQLKNAVIRAAAELGESGVSPAAHTEFPMPPSMQEMPQEIPLTAEEWLTLFPWLGQDTAAEYMDNSPSNSVNFRTTSDKKNLPNNSANSPVTSDKTAAPDAVKATVATIRLLHVFERALQTGRSHQQQRAASSPTRQKENEKKQAQGMKLG